MSYETQPAFVHRGYWNAHSREHPAMKFLEAYTAMFDRRGYETEAWSDWFTSDNLLVKGDGTEFHGGEAAWAAAKDVYVVFAEYYHSPYFCVVVETEDGWELLGQAYVFGNLVGKRGEGEKEKVKDDRGGKEWDVKIPGAFHFQFVKGQGKHGVLLKRTDLHTDGLPVGMTLVKRGVIQLG